MPLPASRPGRPLSHQCRPGRGPHLSPAAVAATAEVATTTSTEVTAAAEPTEMAAATERVAAATEPAK